MYLTGATNDRIEARLIELGVGLMLNPRSAYRPERIARYSAFAIDNGCYSQGDSFDEDAWLRYVQRFIPHAATCLFVVAPDVFGDGPATLARSLPVLPRIRALGLPAAFVIQPGMTVETMPWPEMDAVFTGGPNHWQRSQTVSDIVTEARRRGLHCHRGRVNSGKRLIASAIAGYDSCDGTYIAYNPEELTERVGRWLGRLNAQRRLWDDAA